MKKVTRAKNMFLLLLRPRDHVVMYIREGWGKIESCAEPRYVTAKCAFVFMGVRACVPE